MRMVGEKTGGLFPLYRKKSQRKPRSPYQGRKSFSKAMGGGAGQPNFAGGGASPFFWETNIPNQRRIRSGKAAKVRSGVKKKKIGGGRKKVLPRTEEELLLKRGEKGATKPL